MRTEAGASHRAGQPMEGQRRGGAGLEHDGGRRPATRRREVARTPSSSLPHILVIHLEGGLFSGSPPLRGGEPFWIETRLKHLAMSRRFRRIRVGRSAMPTFLRFTIPAADGEVVVDAAVSGRRDVPSESTAPTPSRIVRRGDEADTGGLAPLWRGAMTWRYRARTGPPAPAHFFTTDDHHVRWIRDISWCKPPGSPSTREGCPFCSERGHLLGPRPPHG